MPYKDKEKQKAAMRAIMERQRTERIQALNFIREEGLELKFSEYVKRQKALAVKKD